MIENLKIGVIIQGPIISRGLTGANSIIPGKEVSPKDIIDYNCVPNIIDLYSRYNCEFHSFICVTWNTEPTAELEAKIGKKNVIQISDTTPTDIPKETNIKANNKYRQFLSTLRGLEVLKNNGCTHAIKIRTDLNLDLLKIKKKMFEVFSLNKVNNQILVAGGNINKPDRLIDLYFAGTTNCLIETCNTFLNKPEFYKDVHLDLFYKLSWWFNGNGCLPINKCYTKDEKYSKLQWSVIKLAWSTIFSTLPREIFKDAALRGEKFPNQILDKYFYDDKSNSEINAIISKYINWPIYRIYNQRYSWIPRNFKKFIRK